MRRILCILLAFALFSVWGCAAFAAVEALPPLNKTADPEGFAVLPVYLDGLLRLRGYTLREEDYLPLNDLCACFGVDCSWSADDKTMHISLGNISVDGKAEQPYFTADSRYLYAPGYWFVYNGELYLPEWPVCRLFNLKSERRESALDLDGSDFQLLRGGADYYDLNCSMEDVYWLSHIIASEARREPLEGKIGVGNVVLNRVADPNFPDTVFDVVFDYAHTIQFEPVSKGTIHEDPSREDLIAAYLVLEGANTAGKCIYFVNPELGSDWFDNNLQYVKDIGHHRFYVSR